MTTLSKEQESFSEVIGDVPPSSLVVNRSIGREVCVYCGHPSAADKVVLEIKEAAKSSNLCIIEAMEEWAREQLNEPHQCVGEDCECSMFQSGRVGAFDDLLDFLKELKK